MGDEFPISGSIDPTSFPFLLANLHQQGATGSLKVDGTTYQKALYFRGGRILFGSSNDPRDQLGSILIESGKLTEAQLDEANAKVGPGNPLAKVLADGGGVTQRELGDAAKVKVERILSDLLTTDEGSFEFEDDVLPKGAIDLKLPTQRLFVAAMRRVSDRAFVVRHVGGLDTVLQPVARSAERVAEVLGDVSGLPDAFDGRRTLRDAARLAKLDDAEAGRLTCALLFLGLIEKSKASADAFQALESEADGLDFTGAHAPAAGTPAGAHEAGFPHEAGDTPFFLSNDPMPPSPVAAPTFTLDPAVFAPAPEPEPAPTVILSKPPDTAATTIVPRPAPPVPEAPAEATVVLRPPPAVTPLPAQRAAGSALPLVPPPPRPARAPVRPKPRADEAEPTLEAPTLAPRPSKADLEALDTLLNSRSLESPLAGSTAPAAAATPARKPPAWEPSFGRGTVARGRKPPVRQGRSRLGLVIALVVLALAALGVGGWWWLSRSKPVVVAQKRDVGVVRPRELATPGPVAAAPAAGTPSTAVASTSPAATPSQAPLTQAPASAPPTSTPATPAPATARPTAPPARAQAAAGPDDARARLQRGELASAGQAFAATLQAASRDTYSVQLLLACADETVHKAVANANAPELFIVPIRYRGRACWRVCWGLYEGRARAESARHSVPAYFRGGGAKVVAASELLR